MSSVANSLLQKIPTSKTALLSFLKKYNSHDNKSVYLLVEGKDDSLYYRNCSATSFVGHKLIPVIAGNKKGVLYVHKQIQSRHDIDPNKVLFFIDRDFDNFLICPPSYDSEVYVTDGYSIENTACRIESCCDFIDRHSTSKYGLNKEESSEVSNLVENALSIFRSSFIPLTSILIVCKWHDIAVNYNNVNVKSYFSFSNGVVSPKVSRTNLLHRFLGDCSISEKSLSPYFFELCNTNQKLKSYSLSDIMLIIRGKYLYDFISKFMYSLSGYPLSDKTIIRISQTDLDALLLAGCPPRSLCRYVNSRAKRLIQ